MNVYNVKGCHSEFAKNLLDALILKSLRVARMTQKTRFFHSLVRKNSITIKKQRISAKSYIYLFLCYNNIDTVRLNYRRVEMNITYINKTQPQVKFH